MKSINNNFLGILSALCLFVGLGACTDEVEYTGATPQDATQAYFPTNLPTQIDLADDAVTFTVEVSRMEAGSELTVNLKKSGDEKSLFTVPATVTFAADAKTASIAIGYTADKFELDTYMPLTISIDSESTNPYSSSSYSFTAGIPAPYTTIGMVNFRDDYLSVFTGITPQTYNVELQENSVTPGLYRLVNPYQKNPYAAEGGYDTSKNYYLTIDATDPECVYIPSGQPLGLTLNANYGMLIAYSYAGYLLDSGKSKEEVKAQGAFGTLKDNIITFPIKGLLVAFTLEEGLFYANNNGAFALSIDPKTQLKNYDLSAECSNISIDMAGNTTIAGSIEWGTDIAYARLAVVEAKMVNEAIDGILDGSIESVKQTAAGKFEIPFSATGKLAVLAIGFDGEDNAQAAFAAEFTYNAGDSNPYEEFLPNKSIDDYVGTWNVPAYDTGELQGYLPVVVTKKDESTLVINGLFTSKDRPDYDDSVEMSYDKETGFVELGYTELPDFTHSQVGTVSPVFLGLVAGNNVSDTDALVGGLTESGSLTFVNKVGNSQENSAFAILGVAGGELYSFSFDFGFEWLAPKEDSKQTSYKSSSLYANKLIRKNIVTKWKLHAPVFTLK